MHHRHAITHYAFEFAEQNEGDLSSSEERVGEERFELSVFPDYLIIIGYTIIILNTRRAYMNAGSVTPFLYWKQFEGAPFSIPYSCHY